MEEILEAGPSLRKYNLVLYLCLLILRINNYVKFFIQSLLIVRNMENSIETLGDLCIELRLSVVQRSLNKLG